jgi:hypothetical protein
MTKDERLLRKLLQVEPEAHVTYHHPHGNSAGGYGAHVWGRELSGLCDSRTEAIESALRKIDSLTDDEFVY